MAVNGRFVAAGWNGTYPGHSEKITNGGKSNLSWWNTTRFLRTTQILDDRI